MDAVDTLEFPFVPSLPKVERKKVSKAVEMLNDLREARKHDLVPPWLAGQLLRVHRSRVGQFMDDGRLERVVIGSSVFVTEKSLLEFMKVERKTGRPKKQGIIGDVLESAKIALDAAKESRK